MPRRLLRGFSRQGRIIYGICSTEFYDSCVGIVEEFCESPLGLLKEGPPCVRSRPLSPKPYMPCLEGHGDLVSRLVPPLSRILTPIIQMVNLLPTY